ncbi:MAG TPA: tetratricopeptide repeat protein [Verrucomicrobiae bacterium]|nr:tetratricopeptide repeat protein [Verrucomicrobiae bacterium]
MAKHHFGNQNHVGPARPIHLVDVLSDFRWPNEMKLRSETTPAGNGGGINRTRLFLKSPAALSLLLFLLTVGTFLPTLKNDFVNFDDPIYVVDNIHVNRGLTWAGVGWAFHATAGGIWLPLTWLSHMLDCQLYGLKPWGHHLTNVLLHALNTALVFSWVRRMTGATWRSFLLAAFFGLHPLRVESVAWVAERKDVLSGLFWLLTLWAYVEFVKRSQSNASGAKRCYALAVVFFLLGLMAKPMLVTLPFVLLLLDYWPLSRLRDGQNNMGRLMVEKWPFFLLSTLASIVTFVVQQHEKAVVWIPPRFRIENAVVSCVRYIGKLFWPENLCVYYPHPGYWPLAAVFLSAILLAIISLIFIRQRRRYPYLLFGWLWFLGTLIPVLGLVQVGQQAMADRYTYLPQIGLMFCLVWVAQALTGTWKRQTLIPSLVATAAIIACMILTGRQIAWWRDSETLFRHTLAVTNKNILAHIDLGMALCDAGRTDEAIEQYHAALRINPDDSLAHNDLGVALSRQGRLAESISEYRQALQIQPGNADAHRNLGDALSKTGHNAEALTQLQQALALAPEDAATRIALGNVLNQLGRPADAIGQYQQAIRLKPGSAEVYNSLGVTLGRLGRREEAVQQLQKAVRLAPDSSDFHYNLGNALVRIGDLDGAIEQFRTSLKLDPQAADAHNNLGAIFLQQKRLNEAIVQFQEALKLKPGFTDAQRNLAAALRVRNGSSQNTNDFSAP